MSLFEINQWLLKFKTLIFIKNINYKEAKANIKEILTTEFGELTIFININ